MNPLDVPFGKKPKQEQKKPVPNFIGVRNEAVRDDLHAEKKVIVSVSGVKGAVDGTYEIAWSKGQTLGLYLSRLKLKRVAVYAAVRNLKNLELGRLRMTYIPAPGDHISVGNSRVSSALSYQRSNHNAERIASNMGGGARFVDVALGRNGKR